MDARGWGTAKKPHSLFFAAYGSAPPRKASLCLCACIRLFWDLITNASFQHAVNVWERVADNMPPQEDVDALRKVCRAFPYHQTGDWRAYKAVIELVESTPVPWRVMGEVLQVIRDQPGRQQLCAIIRDVFGNPFRPVTFHPDWRTDTAVTLARQMYDSREFSAMPILADALQDAGCDNDELLTHCRDANQVHVRGCWVVDLVLDKA